MYNHRLTLTIPVSPMPVLDADENCITESATVVNRWTEYCIDIFKTHFSQTLVSVKTIPDQNRTKKVRPYVRLRLRR
ncbi:hypothetical protein DPMN_038075 [Dreissena polymorpha]|uniref:Uncharacterized protein n=1 Tax=Dreissena polymorpha TaxID=45954 RepID=A0A9D4MC36_DREPO|nr:hypothetical protein DPMN_038075 [Dreissena polymorpha]